MRKSVCEESERSSITKLYRTTGDAQDNEIEMDDLLYEYYTDSNKLKNVSDAVSSGNTGGFVDGNTNPALADYEYDQNGNMILDRNKGIQSISYNHLNLPTEIIFDSTHKVSYIYNSLGQKLKKTVRDGNENKVVDYLDGFQYAGNVLQFFPHTEGYVNVIDDNFSSIRSFDYVFNYTDHLGNIRLSYTKNPQTGVLEILDETHYYPFGLKHEVYIPALKQNFVLDQNTARGTLTNVTETDYQYKYNGKEFQDELGLGLYDYGWRNYDPAIARWVVADPLLNDLKTTIDFNQIIEESNDVIDMSIAFSEKMKVGGGVFNPDNLNPYSYGYNNPVSFDDPDGRCPACVIVWGIIEAGLTIYDGVEVARTFLNPNASTTEKAVVLGGFGLGLAAPGGGYGAIGKFIAKQLTSKTNKVVNKVLKNTSVTSTTSKGGVKTTQRTSSGGLDEANKKFDKMKPKNVREIKDKKTDEVIGREGTLPDGSSVNVRTKSSDTKSEATLEVQRKDLDGKVIEKEKVRFTE